MIAILKYNTGNSTSVKNSVERLGYECIITDNETELLKADKVIFPGVGEAKSAMKHLIDNGLDKVILKIKKPFLGICLGMQLMCESTEEGNTKCLGIFNTKVKLFPSTKPVPHVGWNNFTTINGLLFKDIALNNDVYFVHSYYVELNPYSIAECDYILPFCVAINYKNYYGTQFHPEKSSEIGQSILKNFLKL